MYKINFNYTYYMLGTQKVTSRNNIIYTEKETLSSIENVITNYIIEEAKEKQKEEFQLLEIKINELKNIEGIIR